MSLLWRNMFKEAQEGKRSSRRLLVCECRLDIVMSKTIRLQRLEAGADQNLWILTNPEHN